MLHRVFKQKTNKEVGYQGPGDEGNQRNVSAARENLPEMVTWVL